MKNLVFILTFTFSIKVLASTVTPSSQASQITELERYGYRVNPSAEELIQARQKISSAASIPQGRNCGFAEQISDNRTIGYYDSVIEEMTPFILQNYSRQCVQELLAQYEATKHQHGRYLLDAVPCRNPNNTITNRDERCPLIIEYRNNFQAIQQRLTDALTTPTERNRVCSASLNVVSTPEELTSNIIAILGEQDQAVECSDLEVGQSDVRNQGLHLEYLLERKTPNRLQATLTIDLQRTSHSSMSQPDMFNRIKTCIEASSQFFKSPSGEQLNVTIISPTEAQSLPANKRPATQVINYGTNFGRGNAANYDEDFDCQTMSHELLHSMGILDEYHEGGGGYAVEKFADGSTGGTIQEEDPNYEILRDSGRLEFISVNNSCRSISLQNPSIMGQVQDAMDRMLGERTNCKCKNEDPRHYSNCQNLLSSGNQNHIDLLSFRPRSSFARFCRFDATDPANNTRELSISQLNNLPEQKLVEIININANSFKIYTRNLRTDTYSPQIAALLRTAVSTCTCTESSCRPLFDRIKNATPSIVRDNQCPYGLEENNDDFLMRFRGGPTASEATRVVSSDTVQVNAPPTNPTSNFSLLQPAQFTRLKYGSCQSRAEKFNECQRYAYVSTCEDRPAYCDDESQWLMEEQ